MAAVKSKSGIYCCSKLEDNAQGMNGSKMCFSIFDTCLVLFSMVTFIMDLSTDVFLVVEYFSHGHTCWAVSTFLLVVLPATVVQMFSMRWHIMDKTASRCHWLSHLFFLGIIHRYILVLKTGLEARSSGDPTDFQRVYHQQSDICLLHLFESFMESAPQLVLQLYIMVSLETWTSWTGVSAIASLLSLAWAVAVYTRSMHRACSDKTHVSWPGLVCQAAWRGGMVTARIATLVLFAVGFHAWLFLFLGVHWLCMMVWIVFQKTGCYHTPWDEYIYNCVVGVIYCFCFFNLQEGQSRHHALMFYVIVISQNLGCLGLFLALAGVSRSGLIDTAGALIIGGTVLGPIALCSKQLQHSMECGTPPCLSDLNMEQTATVRSLKHCWQTDKNVTLTRLDGVSPQESSPHSDDVCTDKNLLLTHWVSGQTSPSLVTEEKPAGEHEDKSAVTVSASRDKRRGICSPLELGLDEQEEKGGGHGESMRKHKRRGICLLEPEMEVELDLVSRMEEEPNSEERRQKRRGICSPGLLDLELRNKDENEQQGICSVVELTREVTEMETSTKQPDDETPSEVLSVPSDVLSAHDYENICAVNIAREVWGLRSWRGYSDIETWLHDDSVVRDRRRDTLTSTTTTLTSASSDHSGGNDSHPASPPPLPCRRPASGPRALRTRQDDYLDTLIDDLADCETSVCFQEFIAEEHDPSMFVARPYVVDQHGALFPLMTLDTIIEELEESSTSTETIEPLRHEKHHDSASTLVATINEIRRGGSICSLYNSADVLWEVQCPSFCDPVPESLLTTRHSRAHLSPEEILFLSKLQPIPDTKLELSPISKGSSSPKTSPEVILDASPYLESVQDMDSICAADNVIDKVDDSRPGKKDVADRPCQNFSLLREKFESKQTVSNIEVDHKTSSECPHSCSDCSAAIHDDSGLNILSELERKPIICLNKENMTSVVPGRIKQWNNYLKAQNSCNSRLGPEPCKIICLPSGHDSDLGKLIKPSLRERRSMFLRQVLSPSWGKKSSLSPNTKVVPAT
ncbi:uncharacterized protein LOC110827380 isoform X2 [Zootermopsis nevadensis]|uniref:uncharacterized protein LOC110827380 isoform X2 n=1 Tax=Zootermopsis nevadensis TaxID=136037 RepID=UPI000B8EE4AD|nr:uncharacterized protein LOC110827380 isoform X2 [Zootermopsis nevadensis]